ncbi:MAG: hypothetical protein Kow0059_08210 [Candidatus Sumerlaeia bacterium]
MRRTAITLTLIILAAGLSGCGFRAPVIPPFASTFTNYSAPLDIKYNSPIGQKSGNASTTSILGLISFGEAGVDAAVREGGLQRVDYIAYEATNVMGIYQSWKTIVYGE